MSHLNNSLTNEVPPGTCRLPTRYITGIHFVTVRLSDDPRSIAVKENSLLVRALLDKTPDRVGTRDIASKIYGRYMLAVSRKGLVARLAFTEYDFHFAHKTMLNHRYLSDWPNWLIMPFRKPVKFPDCDGHFLAYSAVDHQTGSSNGRLFVTMANETGIFFGPLEKLVERNPNNLFRTTYVPFVKPETPSRRTYHGLAVDSNRRVLYCCSPTTHEIGAWALKDGEFLANYCLSPTVGQFRISPITCALSNKSQVMAFTDAVQLHLVTLDRNGKQQGPVYQLAKDEELDIPLTIQFDYWDNLVFSLRRKKLGMQVVQLDMTNLPSSLGLPVRRIGMPSLLKRTYAFSVVYPPSMSKMGAAVEALSKSVYVFTVSVDNFFANVFPTTLWPTTKETPSVSRKVRSWLLQNKIFSSRNDQGCQKIIEFESFFNFATAVPITPEIIFLKE